MAIDFAQRTFGAPASSNNGAGNNNNGEQKRSQYWLNVGYTVEGEFANGDTTRFVSLPTGMALDGMEPFRITGNNAEFRALRSAQNDLLEQVMAVAESLQPGEEKILNLQLQLRRVKDDQEPVAASNNPFSRKLEL